MAVIKLSSSGKQVQVVADDGTVYCTSAAYLRSLLYGHMPKGFILMNKFPNKVAPGRYKISEVYDPSGKYKEVQEGEDLKNSNDAYSKQARDANKQEKVYSQKVVDF